MRLGGNYYITVAKGVLAQFIQITNKNSVATASTTNCLQNEFVKNKKNTFCGNMTRF
jgi:hypothetical protein